MTGDLPRRLDDFDADDVDLIDLEDARDLRQQTHEEPQVAASDPQDLCMTDGSVSPRAGGDATSCSAALTRMERISSIGKGR
jgi:hypothetical protein